MSGERGEYAAAGKHAAGRLPAEPAGGKRILPARREWLLSTEPAGSARREWLLSAEPAGDRRSLPARSAGSKRILPAGNERLLYAGAQARDGLD